MCSSCRKQVTDEQAKGTTCPHCGARWQFNQYANASSTTSSKSGAGLMPMSPAEAEKTVRSVVLVVAILGVVVVLVGGIILAALAIASASRPRKPTYQQPYRPYQ
jgi:heme/copper-type cytochrome/quinol oxidase subunit 2